MELDSVLLPDRFWAKVVPEPTTGCWLWTASGLPSGHGMIGWGSRKELAHRLSLSMSTGVDLRDDRLALHRCNTPACVNPAHLYWGTYSDNTSDQVKDGTHTWARKTHCPSGHPYSEDNTLVRGSKRVCLTCKPTQDRVNQSNRRRIRRASVRHS